LRGEAELLETVCLQFGLDPDLIRLLIEKEESMERRVRRRGIFQSLRAIIEERVREEDALQGN
jgi:hypothetical protein